MLGTILLINLAGAVALLLWGTHMVSSGVLRGFGTALRNLREGEKYRGGGARKIEI
ncbi:hypothetical protein KGZ19_09550 [Pseudomonas aeruginosa]|nr:hypothetical protein [Pseudomonas aeruginosa]